MATKVLVNGKFKQRAGVYSTIKSAIKNPSTQTPYGNVLIIDDGIGAGFGGGSGVNGHYKSGVNAVYDFNSSDDFKAFVKGGTLWNLSKPLFNPAKGQNGVSKLYFVKAATTSPAQMAWNCASGTFTIQTKDEGTNANGVLDANGHLIGGYTSNFKQIGSSFAFQIFHTSYKGLDTLNGSSFDGIDASAAIPQLVIQSPLFTKLADLLNWFNADIDFNDGFELIASNLKTVNDETKATATLTIDSVPAINNSILVWAEDPVYGYVQLVNMSFDGTLATTADVATAVKNAVANNQYGYTASVAGDVVTVTARNGIGSTINNNDLYVYANGFIVTSTNFSGGINSATSTGLITVGDCTPKILASGATESYNASDLDAVLSKINNLDFTHILSLQGGVNATGANNGKIQDWLNTASKYDRYLVMAGGLDKSQRTLSKQISAFYNSDKVTVVHGGVKKTARVSGGFKIYDSLYHAAAILGRTVGLPSQVPVTLKSIDVDGFVDVLEDDDQEDLITAGVMYSYYDYEVEAFVVGNMINTLQNNKYLINDDGSTYSWQLKRIEAELNKSIIINGKKRFFDPNGQGGNRNTASAEEVTAWAQKHLQTKVATDKQDNLIISFKNVAASINQDNISLTYDFVGNTEIKALLSTGTLIEG